MKNLKKVLFLFMVGYSLFFINICTVKADDTNYLNIENEDSNKVVNHSLFTAGDDISIDSNINGINFAAGNTLDIKGSSEYGLIAGNEIDFNGLITRDLFLAGNKIKISKTANIARDVYIAGNNITVNADIKDNLFLAGKKVVINSKNITGNVKVAAGTLKIADDTEIKGTLLYNQDATYQTSKATINKIETYQTEQKEEDVVSSRAIASFLIEIVTSFLILLMLYYILPGIFIQLDRMSKDTKLLNTMGQGFIYLLAVPVISLVAMATIVGLPLGVVLLFFYIVTISLSRLISAIYFGKLMAKKIFHLDNIYLELLIGIISIKIISMIPYIGFIYLFIMIILGLGLMYNMYKKLRIKTK